jgi:tRNA(Ile2) C34 agmatinyltransferase TiaS
MMDEEPIQEMDLIEAQALQRAAAANTGLCPRCNGRLMSPGRDGDRACFTCGHVSYALEPIVISDVTSRRRRPSHGGSMLA